MLKKHYDPSAMGSDVARSRSQYIARKFASFVVSLLRLNQPGFLTTEIVQSINPVCHIKTKFGEMHCLGGHGRLLWRAKTFYTEEPETIKWLETIKKNDLLWDIGANVGLYGIYATLSTGCKVISFEPEAMNYAILIKNIVLNNIQSRLTATNIALTRKIGMGNLYVGALTYGGAWNQFKLETNEQVILNHFMINSPITQLQMGISMDELVENYNFECPSHIKIDVDGNEPEIIAGGEKVLKNPRLVSILIEQERGNLKHKAIYEKLISFGFKPAAIASTGESRAKSSCKNEWQWRNIIWERF